MIEQKMMFGDALVLSERALKKWIRNPFAVIVGTIQGIIWMVLFGNSFDIANVLSSFAGAASAQHVLDGAPNYITFLAPGVICIVALTSMSFMGVDLVFDRLDGYLDEISCYPIARSAIYFGGVFQNVGKSMVLAVITFVLALIVPNGMKLVNGFGVINLVGIFGAIVLLIGLFAALFTGIAVSVKTTDSFFAVVNFLTLPIMFTSTALFPANFFPGWLKPVAQANPLSLASSAARLFIVNKSLSATQFSSFAADMLGLCAYLAFFAVLGTLMAKNALKAK